MTRLKARHLARGQTILLADIFSNVCGYIIKSNVIMSLVICHLQKTSDQ